MKLFTLLGRTRKPPFIINLLSIEILYISLNNIVGHES
jgi:hypothetical protein